MFTKTAAKEEFEMTDCIVCGADDTDKICKRGQFGLPAHVVVCRQCGLTYLNPRWNKARLTKFYEQEYDKYYRPTMNSDVQKSSYISMYERIKSKGYELDNIKNVLDVGSGEGNNLKFIIKQMPKAEFYAIEPSPTCRKALKEINVNILGTDVDQEFDPTFRGFFDFIIMRHVLEHFADPVKVISEVKKLLKEDGILYIAVPNSLSLGNYNLLTHYFRTVHTYYFNIHSLENVFKKAGVEVLWMKEGDSYNQRELFALVKKGKEESISINKELYKIQTDLFDPKLKKERSAIHRLKNWWAK